MKESRGYSELPNGDIECSIRWGTDNWILSATGTGVNKTEAFRQALKTLVNCTSINTQQIYENLRHK